MTLLPNLTSIPESWIRATATNYPRGGTSEALTRTQWITVWGSSVLYKKYKAEVLADPAFKADVLRQLVGWRVSLDTEVRERLDGFSSFPLAVVIGTNNQVTGVLIPEAHERFVYKTPKNLVRGRSVEQLARRPEDGNATHGHYHPSLKLAVLGLILDALAFLHELNLVFGDLHPGNILVTGNSVAPSVYFVDCDALLLGGKSAFPVLSPDLWKVPSENEGFSPVSDRAKYVLLVRRVMGENTNGQGIAVSELEPWVSRIGAANLNRAGAGDVSLSTQQLRVMAHAWTKLRSHANGAVANFRLDEDGYRKEVRAQQKGLDLRASRVPKDPAPSSANGGATQKSGNQSGAGVPKRTTSPDKPSRGKGIVVAAIFVVLFLLALAILFGLPTGPAKSLGTPAQMCVQSTLFFEGDAFAHL